jgi:hypothetical protein
MIGLEFINHRAKPWIDPPKTGEKGDILEVVMVMHQITVLETIHPQPPDHTG